MKFFALFWVVSLSLVSCATYQLEPVAQEGVTVREGRGLLWSVVEHDGVTVEAAADWGYEICFRIKVTNQGPQKRSVDSSLFTLFSGEPDAWRQVDLPSGDEYFRAVEREARVRSVVTVTEVPYRRSTSTTYISGSGHTVTIIRSEPDPFAEFESTEVVTVVPTGVQRRLEILKDELFFSANLEPGESYSGSLYVEQTRGPQYKLVVPVGGKDYELVFERVKKKGPFTNLD